MHNLSSDLVLFPINFDSSSVGKKLMVGNKVGLNSRITTCTIQLQPVWTSSWGIYSICITLLRENCWSIYCDPELYSVTKCFEAHICVVCKILPDDISQIHNVKSPIVWFMKWLLFFLHPSLFTLHRIKRVKFSNYPH